ncbi:SDR family NAD(P)-dependent oxidoreductase [Nocardiopsis ganjiahuensis]|uniref:SDR family NAD(P)-dependent oxidoreductase n=1 Tax=Nocardiopsis ganjiahuensis TaxID=239984 RepID=UPI00034910BB|nr:SDR family oxidoreductase [Nocardiopsis ganjiahuensis]
MERTPEDRSEDGPGDGSAPGPGDGTVVVVGGTSGIGAAVAARFADRGHRVAVCGLDTGRTPTGLRERVEVTELDVTGAGAPEDYLAAFPRVTALVNAAGIIRRREEFDPAVFARVVEVNLTSTMRACVAARPALEAAGGSVVNIASMLSFFGGPLVPAYSASKGGITQLTKSLAVAWAPRGVRVNAVAPGWIRTELTEGVRASDEAEARILDRTPMARWGDPAEVAGAVEFLCGPDAGFVTGAVLPVDGGYLAA